MEIGETVTIIKVLQCCYNCKYFKEGAIRRSLDRKTFKVKNLYITGTCIAVDNEIRHTTHEAGNICELYRQSKYAKPGKIEIPAFELK